MRDFLKVRSFVSYLTSAAKRWKKRAENRRILAQLTTADLHDIGLTEGDVYFELRKPFWRA